jgi:hypothetical protein
MRSDGAHGGSVFAGWIEENEDIVKIQVEALGARDEVLEIELFGADDDAGVGGGGLHAGCATDTAAELLWVSRAGDAAERIPAR